jgi:transcriptional regulator with XRE-family HTH domain
MPMPSKPSPRPSEQKLVQALGSRVQELRENQGLSQRALSEHLQIPKSILSEIEAGIRAPTVNVLVRLATHFGVSLDSLLGRDLRDPRLVRCLLKIQSMDEGSRVAVVDAIEGIANAYATLFERGDAKGSR